MESRMLPKIFGKGICLAVLTAFFLFSHAGYTQAAEQSIDLLSEDFYDDDFLGEQGGDEQTVSDPLEPFNRVMFEFNDKLYFWFLKPVNTGYSAVVPYDLRLALGNFFYNIASPVRLVNNLLQGEFADAGMVLSRFCINTTMGVFGFGDPAAREYGIKPRPADFGQTLGKWGIGDGIYFVWPLLGPSNVRDSVGIAGDIFVHPVYHFDVGTYENIAYYGVTRINLLSLQPSVYEELKRIALDPYVAARQGYIDFRRGLITTTQDNLDENRELQDSNPDARGTL